MSSGIKNSQLLDLLATTLPDLPDNDFSVAWNRRSYEVCNRWFQSDKVEMDGGVTIDRRIMLDNTGTARYVRLYEPATLNVADVMKRTSIPWCQLSTNFSIERREILRNRNSSKGFIKLIMGRRVDAMSSLADLIEDKAWTTPADVNDDKSPYGVPYWINFSDNGVSGEGDFVGKTIRYTGGTTGTLKANLDGATYSKWRNWAATYTTVNRTLVKRMRRAFKSIRFKSPIMVKDITEGPSSNFRIYMSLDNSVEFEEQAQAQNDNLGSEIAEFAGMVTFKRIPMIDIPQLDSFSITDGGGNAFSPEPIYFINHGGFKPIVQEDDWLVEGEPMNDRSQNNVFTTFVDGSHQYQVENVRTAGAVLHKVIPAA